MTFRLLYFGWPLPNTAYAKVALGAESIRRGTEYVAGFLLVFPHLLVFLLLAAIFTAMPRRAPRATRDLTVMTASVFGFAVVTGGDWMPMGRFLVPCLPFLALLACLLFQRLTSRPSLMMTVGFASIILGLLPAFDVHAIPDQWRAACRFGPRPPPFHSEYTKWRQQKRFAVEFTALGQALALHTKRGESLVAASIGAIGYYSELCILDTVGLVNLEVAHRPTPGPAKRGFPKVVSPAFFLKHKPTYCWARFAAVPDHAPSHLTPGVWFRVETNPAERFFPPEVQLLYAPIGTLLPETLAPSPRRLLVLFVEKQTIPARLGESRNQRAARSVTEPTSLGYPRRDPWLPEDLPRPGTP
ncbi:MAG: hypothetical protein JXQ73_10805 [Phycisphaerae bacterium]|nr:hypothetical protein [Phycisphaerae bacterium]